MFFEMDNPLPKRKILPHETPSWVKESAVFFITLNTRERSASPLLTGNRPTLLWKSAQWQMARGLWWIRLFLIMPDHVHLMASFFRKQGMKTVMKNWKHWTAGSLGIQWQRGFFDHRIRDVREYEEKAFYIRKNPLRKGLVASANDWPHVWEVPTPIW